jgi:filamentous hemagglutinin family protein
MVPLLDLRQKPLELTIALLLSLLAEPAIAQLIPDATLGNQSSTIHSVGQLDVVNGGQRSGRNLFHSFREFNVGMGRSLYFTDPGVTNILTRVTGPNLSKIDGKLGVNGPANLFLLNPNGIVFGTGASLDVRGSFTASTASALQFADGSEFSAIQPSSPNLLTVSVPVGLQRGGNHPQASVTSRGNLHAGQNLTLEASHLDLQGTVQAGQHLNLLARETVNIRDSPTRPFLARAGGHLTLRGDRGIDILALNHPHQAAFQSQGDLHLISNGIISGDARFASGRHFQIQSASGGLATFTSLYDPIITSAGDVNLALNYTGASLLVEAGGNIQIQGTVDITTPDVAAPFVGDDGVLNSQPGLILRSGQSVRRYGSDNGFVPGSAIGSALVANPGITLDQPVTIAPGGIVRLTSGYGNIRTHAITAPGGELIVDSSESITSNGQTLDTATLNGNGGAIVLNALRGPITTGDLLTFSNDEFAISNGGSLTATSGGAATLGRIDTGSLNGRGGDLTIAAASDVRLDDSITFAFVGGDSGHVTITAGGSVTLSNLDTSSDGGQGGHVRLTAAGDVLGHGAIDTSAYGSGQGGDIIVQASGNVLLTNEAVFRSDTFTDGNAGNIAISGRSLILANGSQIRSVSRYGASGNSGTITVNTSDTIQLFGTGTNDIPSAIFTLADLYSVGNGGDIFINTGSLLMRDGSEILTNHFGFGVNTRAGNITIRARDIISLDGFRVRTTEGDSPGTGIGSNVTIANLPQDEGFQRQGGTIDIQAGALTLSNGGYIASKLERGSNGQGGNIQISLGTQTNPGSLVITGTETRTSGIFTTVEADSIGNGGNILVQAGNVTLQNHVGIAAETYSGGNGGQINLQATNLFIGQDAFITAETFADGNAGTVTIAADRIEVTNNGEINAGARGLGRSGNSGTIALVAQSLELSQGGRIEAITFGSGNAGDIQVQANAIAIADQLSGIISGSSTPTRQVNNTGNGGNVWVSTNLLQIKNDGVISTSTFSRGRGGNIHVTANAVELVDLGRLSATTQAQGDAGTITVNARDRLFISGVGSGLFARTTAQTTGNGGSIAVDTGNLSIQNLGRITVDSQGSGNGGNVKLIANQMFLSDRATIFAETASSDGGNIALDVRDVLLLRNQSLISASAGTERSSGNGGNITIKARFIVGVFSENSDIRANAFTGNGGQINATAQGIFGLKFQRQPTPQSDITASSRFGISGTVTLNTPNVDLNRGLVPLASDFTDSTNQIAQTCSPRQQQNSFIITGRGGISPDPGEVLNQTALWQEAAGQIGNDTEAQRRERVAQQQWGKERQPSMVIEATTWQRHADGSVSLVAGAESVTSSIATLACQTYESSEVQSK